MDASIKVAEVAASRGAAWLGASFALFRAAPMGWIGLVTGWVILLFGSLAKGAKDAKRGKGML